MPYKDTGPSLEVRWLIMARSGGRCERCRAPASDIHHRRPRGMGGSRDAAINTPPNLVALCRPCHEWIERHRSYGESAGWLVPRRDRREPSAVPVDSGLHGRVLFTEDGGTTPVT